MHGRRWQRALKTMMAIWVLCSFGALDVLAGESDRRAGDEVKWGYKAARRGYWQEALMRFERADELTPNQPRILNNVAVALEALGRYDEARAVYDRALEIAGNDSALRKNHQRFVEFYTEYVAAPVVEEPSPDAETPPPTEGDTGADEVQGGNDAQG